MTFLDENYLLKSEVAGKLFKAVKDLPIIDSHNHGDIIEIVENKTWSDIWEVEASTDHYVWELMRRRGVSEDNITGSSTNKQKWLVLAGVFPHFIGNPTYEWIHLDLKRRFGINDLICAENAEKIWDETKRQLQNPSMRPQELLKEMKVEIACTTDDPTVHLPYHERAQKENEYTKVFPTWRPDKMMKISASNWKEIVLKLGEETGKDTSKIEGLLDALQATHDYFAKLGCVASDHGLTQPCAYSVSKERAAEIHKKGFTGKKLTSDMINDYQAFMLNQFGQMNSEKNWAMQMHIGVVRDYRTILHKSLGTDSGGDLSTNEINYVENLKSFLNKFDGKLKIVLYCIDPTHLPTIATITRAFANIQLGSGWWFNDSPYGMASHMRYLASVDLLSNLSGMVTDSRKLMSFGSRTEMFRRVLCNVVGDMVNNGQAPESAAFDLVESLSYSRSKKLFFDK